MKLELAVVIPAYNESECIEKVVRSWQTELLKLIGAGKFQMFIVNDGSKDKTGEILDRLASEIKELKPIHKPNGGHGDALYKGYQAAVDAQPEFVFQTDSDDQFKPEDFSKMWEKRNESQAILGWRQSRHDPFHRLVITRILRTLIGLFYGVYLKDSNVPYRLFRTEYLRRLLAAIPAHAFAPNIFLAVLSAKDQQKLFFVPIVHEERQTGVVSIIKWKLLKVCFRSATELIEFRWSLGQRLKNLRG